MIRSAPAATSLLTVTKAEDCSVGKNVREGHGLVVL